jgi:hypothetical protein
MQLLLEILRTVCLLVVALFFVLLLTNMAPDTLSSWLIRLVFS